MFSGDIKRNQWQINGLKKFLSVEKIDLNKYTKLNLVIDFLTLFYLIKQYIFATIERKIMTLYFLPFCCGLCFVFFHKIFCKIVVDERIVNVNICKSKLQKRICRTVGPALAASLEPLAHRRVFSKGIILVHVQLKWLN